MGRVLVTGATGFLGGRVVRRFAEAGVDVVAVGRDPRLCSILSAAGYPVLRHDLSEPLDISLNHPLLDDIDTIIHCAALSSPFGRLVDFTRANVTATANLVDFARRQGVRHFIYISTPSVYFAYRDQLGVREDAPLPSPVNHYTRTKRQAEHIVLGASGIGPVILRPRGIYGAGDNSLLPRLLKAASTRPLPLLRDGAACFDLTHVDDVADAIVAALDAGREAEGEIFNISGGEPLPITEIVDRACACAGITVRWKPTPLAPAMIAAGLMETVASIIPGRSEPPITRYGLGLFAFAQSLEISKAFRILGWKPKIGFSDGLRRTFETGMTS